MQNFYHHFLEHVDSDFLMSETENLWKKEFGQTYQCYHDAAFYTRDLLVKAGIPNVELIEFPADGKSAYCDVRMPVAWDASIGKLTLLNLSGSIVSGPFGGDGPNIVAADYRLHPFSLVKGSVLQGGKKKVRIISETQLFNGADTKNTLVILDQNVHPSKPSIKTLLDLGALGFISDNVTGGMDHPDSLAWFNAATEDGEWHVTASHRPFIGFSTTPRMADFIRNIVKKRELWAVAECDGRRYEGVHHVVTALIPGKQEKEIWAYAHLYEPLPDDDSCGVVAAIETAKQIMREGTPEYSVRLVFAMEFYGYHAYIASRGGKLDKVIGSCNYDGLACIRNVTLKCFTSPNGAPCYGHLIMEQLNEIIRKEKKFFSPEIRGSAYFDDIAFSCPSIGLPAIWPLSDHGDAHHTSRQIMSFLDKETFAQGTAYNTALVYMMANPSTEMFEDAVAQAKKHVLELIEKIHSHPFGSSRNRFNYLCKIERAKLLAFAHAVQGVNTDERIEQFDKFCMDHEENFSVEDFGRTSKWRNYASKIRMQYTATGFPHSLVKTGDHVTFSLPDSGIYGTFSNVIANLHTEMNIAEAIRLAEYERGAEVSEAMVKKYVNTLNRLADYGYLQVKERPTLNKEEIISSLQKLGVKKGDLLLVHASSSNCGYIKGGAETIIAALEEVVGDEGTLLFPSFTQPYIYLGGPCHRTWTYRPYDAADPDQIWTGNIPKTVLRIRKDVLRSRHISHSWCGFGPLAKECLAVQEPDDSPASIHSPMGIAMSHGAKILHFGSNLSTTTFLHLVEDVCNVPYLEDAVCSEKKADGSVELHIINKHLPGHRDFYSEDTFNCKFYKKAISAGLQIRKQALGNGELLLMDTPEYYRIGRSIVEKDYGILLCDNPDCTFCTKYRNV